MCLLQIKSENHLLITLPPNSSSASLKRPASNSLNRGKSPLTSDGKIGYTLPSTLHKRTTSFGIGKRTMFENKSKTPASLSPKSLT